MFSDLPPEVIAHIFHDLTAQDLFACQLTTKYFNDIVCNSVILQYSAALLSAKSVNNACSKLPIAQKLQALRASEKAWSFVRPVFTKSVSVPRVSTSGKYNLTGGVFFLQERTALHYLKLPSSEEDDACWKEIALPKKIIQVGHCIHEHDLIVFVTTTPDRDSIHDRMTFNIELRLLAFSTGKPHPSAQQSCIHVVNVAWEYPVVGIEIVGDHLVLILSFHSAGRPEDCIFIFEWKTNILKSHFRAPWQSYSDLLFLNESLILLPNKNLNSLDIFCIPSIPILDSPNPLLVLGLPELSVGHLLASISCRAGPNPTGANSRQGKKDEPGHEVNSPTDDASIYQATSLPERPFLASAKDAICLFDLHIFTQKSVLDPTRLTFIVPRNALVSLIDKYVTESKQKEQADAGSHQTTSPSFESGPKSTSSSSHSPMTTMTIPWKEWGPPITNWFNMTGISNHCIMSTAGQRYVYAPASPPTSGVPLYVIDFNQANVRNEKACGGRNWSSAPMAQVQPAEVFAEPVESGLPYVGCFSEARYNFDGVLLDQERIVGLTINSLGCIENLHILHFG